MRTLLVISSDARRESAAIEAGRSPRRDYAELAHALDADIFDFGRVVESRVGRLLVKTAGRGIAQALMAARELDGYDVVFSDNERVGTFFSLLLRTRPNRPRHVMLGHHLSPPKKRPLLRAARPAVDLLIVHAEAQRHFAIRELGFSGERVALLPYQVDTDFWQPRGEPDTGIVSSAGLECRDYETLIEAVQGLPLRVNIGAASNWSRKRNRLRGQELPEQISVRSYNYLELRDVYARSSFVAVPLFEVDFQAGVTLILEAMAMGKAVVVSQTTGQTEVVRGPVWGAGYESWPDEGPRQADATGIYVPPGDVAALRSAILYLLHNPEVASHLGMNGRLRVEAEYRLDHFAARFADAITGSTKPVEELVRPLV